MTMVAISVVWCLVQVTALLSVLVILYALLGRATTRARARLLHMGIFSVLGLTGLTFSPWPNWWPPVESSTAASASPVATTSTEPADSAVASSSTTAPLVPASDSVPADGGEPTWTVFAAAFVESLRSPSVVESPAGHAPVWPRIVIGTLIAGAGLGVLRLLAGWWSLAALLRGSRILEDRELVDLLDQLRAECGCRTQVRLRESGTVSPAATCGWRSPTILLSPEWRTWSRTERRAVLAHEVAHVHRGDFVSTLLAELGVLLHFYHPLMHWLSNRVRLEQELAADEAAAKALGGSRPYLTVLAEMSLREPSRRANWCVATFLPTRRTFLRRIEVLRDTQPSQSGRGAVGLVAALTLIATGVAVAGIRGSFDDDSRAPDRRDQAADSKRKATGEVVSKPFDLGWLPPDTMMVFSVDVARTTATPAFRPLLKVIDEDENLAVFRRGPFENVQRFTLGLLPGTEPRGNRPPEPHPILLIHTGRDVTVEELRKPLEIADEPTGRVGSVDYFALSGGGPRQGFFVAVPHPRLIVQVERERFMKYVLQVGETGATKSAWASTVEPYADEQVLEFLNLTALRKMLGPQFDLTRQPALSGLALLAPFWEHVDTAVGGGTIDDGLQVRFTLDCSWPDGAEEVGQTLTAFRTLGRNFVKQARLADLARAEPELRPTLDTLLAAADELLVSASVRFEESRVRVSARVEELPSEALVSMMVDATRNARAAARRTQSMNNLKQIGIAFHNYHEKHGHFPPAVVKKPGRPPYSWRVELLPMLDQNALHAEYRFDEPWDSEANKRVLAKMPDFYRNPEATETTNAGYFVLVGKGTMFDGDEGTRIRDVRDGLSNTLLIVDAKREVPWTKPDDIPVDLSKRDGVPKLGGYHGNVFLALGADGAVHTISFKIDEDLLRRLIGRADGQPTPEF